MNTVARLIVQAIGISLANLLDHLTPSTALRAENRRLRRTLAAEQRRADALEAELGRLRVALKEAEFQVDLQVEDCAWQVNELYFELDDARRLMQQASVSISHHVREHFILSAQVEALTTRNAYVEACLRHRNAVSAGILLVGQVQPEQVSAP
jgi:predicted RNase H-like nuclease (RuvC/YqgF family)